MAKMKYHIILARMKSKISPSEGIEISKTKWWKHFDASVVALAQFQQEFLCMPSHIFVNKVYEATGERFDLRQLSKIDLETFVKKIANHFNERIKS